VGVPVEVGFAFVMLISTGTSLLPCGLGVGLATTGGKDFGALTEAEGVLETGMVVVERGFEGAAEGGAGGATGLKKGRERLPHPGIFTSQPEEIRSKSNNIAEKIDRLFKVSRNRGPRNAVSGIGVDEPSSASPRPMDSEPLKLLAVYGFHPGKSTKSTFLEGFEACGAFQN